MRTNGNKIAKNTLKAGATIFKHRLEMVRHKIKVHNQKKMTFSLSLGSERHLYAFSPLKVSGIKMFLLGYGLSDKVLYHNFLSFF